MKKRFETIDEQLQHAFETLTRAERQVANSLLENYPVSGLGSITTVAEAARVSTPTVIRMVRKLGYKGFPEFQAVLRRELEAKISNPIDKHDTWAGKAPGEHILGRFAAAAIDNIQKSLVTANIDTFDGAVDLMADPDRALFVTGGRISHVLADYFFLHMQVVRGAITHVQSISNAWPHYLLDMKPGDVLVVFDVRRYENSTLKLAKMARARGVKTVLFTDQWRSPVHKHADFSFGSRIEVPSAWDSSVVSLLFVETFIAAVQERTWGRTRQRMETLEDMFDQTRFFRKFT